MSDADRKIEAEPTEQTPSEMPLPDKPEVIFLGGLFALAVLTAAYVARDIVLPMALAITLKLLLQPGMAMMERPKVPAPLAALLIIFTLLGAIIGLGAAISGPAGAWAAKLPEGIP